ncbi:MAG: hypothetical protein IKY93_05455, partial [Alistipes sp.]|nr:hypothetical protein [Alistipes sp.]
MKKLFTLIYAAFGIFSLSAQIIPQPKAVNYTAGEFIITNKSCLVYSNANVREAATYLLNYLPFKQML